MASNDTFNLCFMKNPSKLSCTFICDEPASRNYTCGCSFVAHSDEPILDDKLQEVSGESSNSLESHPDSFTGLIENCLSGTRNRENKVDRLQCGFSQKTPHPSKKVKRISCVESVNGKDAFFYNYYTDEFASGGLTSNDFYHSNHFNLTNENGTSIIRPTHNHNSAAVIPLVIFPFVFFIFFLFFSYWRKKRSKRERANLLDPNEIYMSNF